MNIAKVQLNLKAAVICLAQAYVLGVNQATLTELDILAAELGKK